MIHAPLRPSWRSRLPAHVALAAAVAVKAIPGNARRFRARLVLCRIARRLPPAEHPDVQQTYEAVLACQPPWWRGQIDCKERALATVLATALTGRRCHLVLGARAVPAQYHAWVTTSDGEPVGHDEAGGLDHPWTPVYTTP
ncbi:lasso peptide biosynthesis B2 protein [Streptomyces griseus]|uniref:lasso peptide biosynthesis B2 protein n=1 Tax=Streptomyces griseus TaxID=1911 RepID=UPI0037AE2351